LKDKVYLKIVAIVAASAAFVSFLRLLVRGNAGDWIVAFMQKHFHMRPAEAHQVYQVVIRNNLDFIVIAAIAVCAVILSVSVVWYSRRQRAKAERQLEQRKNDLITYLAHDIKTPLTSVIGYLSLLNETPDMPREQRTKHISVALDKAHRLETLVDEFFEITRYNLQSIPLSPKNIDLYYMFVQLSDEVYPLLAAHNKESIIHAAEDLSVYGDPDKLARAFNNILKNAIFYGEDNSVIDITAKLNNNIVEIEFRNIGIIPKDKLVSIFDKFYRLDEARSNNTGGAGLGLAIAKEIITMHGGQIVAASEHGCTTFTVLLPSK
jgi:two-component system sensor histidine kinase VanS